jgi:hypothetical protein
MNANAVTVVVITASAILSYLLAQSPSPFSPATLLIIGAANIGLTTLSRFLPTVPAPAQKVEITGTVATTPAEDPTNG